MTRPTLVRAGITGATAAVIIAGGGSFAVSVIALLPTLVYAFGVSRARSVAICGVLLFGLTAPAWAFVIFRDDPLRGIWTFPAWAITMATSTHGALRDRRPRER